LQISEHCTLLILDLRCIVLIESIYVLVYPNLFQHVVYVKVKYVFYVEDSITCHIYSYTLLQCVYHVCNCILYKLWVRNIV